MFSTGHPCVFAAVGIHWDILVKMSITQTRYVPTVQAQLGLGLAEVK